MVYTLAFSPHYLHKGDSHGLVNIVSVTWLVLRACSWPALISASVWIFESAFHNQLQVFLHVFFRVFLIKLTMQLFSFQLPSFSPLFQDVFNQLNWQIPHFQYTLPLAVKRPKNSSHTTPNCFPHLSHTPRSLLVGPTSILPLYIQLINISFWMESTIHCQHLSRHFIQCFQFFLCPSYLFHTWSALTAAQVLIAIALFFQFNLDFNISFSLLFYSLECFFISFSFIKSASIIPRYLYLLSTISSSIRPYKRVIPSNLTFFSLVITNTVVIEVWN